MSDVAIILTIFVLHWVLSVFSQTFYLHRYAAHAMFTMNRFWERTFHIITLITQGSSYLSPYGYAVLHRMHHAFSDTEQDPHSPHQSSNVFTMMLKTKQIYHAIVHRELEVEERFTRDVPDWPIIDKMFHTYPFRIAMGTLITLIYMYILGTNHMYLYALLPIHWLMGPIHGAIVNWAGHKYGYVNHKETGDLSKNTLPFDFVTMGELFQNNHHNNGTNPNFASKWFEIDPTYHVMQVFNKLGIIRWAEKPA